MRQEVAGRLRRRERGAVILLYHRLADVPLDPSGLSVSPARFAAQMAALVRTARPVPLDRVAETAGDRSPAGPPGAVAVTFDDGYADNLTIAMPILARRGIPATVFIPSVAVGRTRPFWWDELETLVFGADALPGSLDIEIGGRRLAARVRDDGGGRDLSGRYRAWRVWHGAARTPRQALFELLWRALRELREPELDAALAGLADWVGVSRPAAAHPTLDAGGVRRLADGELIALGAHSMTHPFLPAHAAEVQREEIAEGRRRLEDAVGVRTSSFAYPYGAHDDTTTDLVRETGFERAVTTRWGAVTPDTDPYRLPRLTVGEWSARRFRRHLRRHLPRR